MGVALRDRVGEPGRRAGLLVAALGAGVVVVALIGTPYSPGMAVGAFLLKLGAAWPSAVYLAAGFGLGWPVARLARGVPDAVPVQFGVGLAVLFGVSETLGVAGLLNSATAIGVCAVGLGLLGWQAVGAARAGARVRVPGLAWMLACPAVGVLLVASAMPPGWLWGSEYAGFDALSYHLELPQEWLAMGRIAPLEHNVYSYLPGSMEAAFTHLGWMTLASERGLLGGDGWRLVSCHWLAAGMALIAAWLTARAAQRLAAHTGAGERIARWAGAVAGCVAITTPWAVVTGSLAYNEAGVNAMLAAALLVGVQPGLGGRVRGGLVGLLVGAACGFKPTALFFVGVPAGVVMVYGCAAGSAWRRELVGAVAAGALVGLLTLAPWLVRNWLHGGNPVFPFAADLFGAAHWTAEQVERYRQAHSFDGSVVDRVRTLVWTSPGSSPGDPAVERFRGLANPQWGMAPVFVLLACVALAFGARRFRGAALVLLLALVAMLGCWLSIGHLQSRFLLPTLVPGAVLIGLAFARLRVAVDARPDGRAGVALLAGVVVATQTVFLFAIYAGQQGGSPGRALPVFPELFTGLTEDPPDSSAAGWCNRTAGEGGLVYLIGDSTPLYFGPGVLYHTTYDRSPLGELMRAHPGDPKAWAAGLRERGVGWLLVNDFELRRLAASGWYDAAVTSEAVHRFAEALGGAERAWPEEGRYAVRLSGNGGAP